MADALVSYETPEASPEQLRDALESASLALSVAATHHVMPSQQRSLVRNAWHLTRRVLGAPTIDEPPGLNDWARMIGAASGGTARDLAIATLKAAIHEARAAGLSRQEAAALLSAAWLDQGGGHGGD